MADPPSSLVWHTCKPAPRECEDGATLLASCSASEAACAHPAFEQDLLAEVEACADAAGAEVPHLSVFISDNVLIKWFLSSHFIHKPVKLLFTILLQN